MGPIKNITHYISHIIQLRFPTKNTHHVTTKIEPQNYVISTKKYPKSFNLWAKHKGPTKPSYKAHYDMASLKPATMWHLQSPLRCSISKTRYDTTIFLQNPTKPKCQFGTYFIKPKHYYLAPILQSPNINLAHIFIKPKY